MSTIITTNGTHGPTGHQTDSDLDALYAWHVPQPTPQPCPEALFSCTLRGKLDGQEALLTARGMTAAEFKANLQAITGLLDPVPQPAPQPASQGQEGFCQKHDVHMKLTTKEGRSWWSHYDQVAGKWCKGK
jgi:hypothetical protein